MIFPLLDLSRTDMIGIIATIAVVSISLAVCFYLVSLKDKNNKK